MTLDPDNDRLLVDRAQALIAKGNSGLYLVHAVEYMSSYGAAYGVSAGVDVENMLLKESKKLMRETSFRLNVPSECQIIKVGPAKSLILDQAERLGVDLILVGSHGRHGVQLLLGSTANAVLHGAKCDVLAVRLRDSLFS